jgi:hypothetical protein
LAYLLPCQCFAIEIWRLLEVSLVEGWDLGECGRGHVESAIGLDA